MRRIKDIITDVKDAVILEKEEVKTEYHQFRGPNAHLGHEHRKVDTKEGTVTKSVDETRNIQETSQSGMHTTKEEVVRKGPGFEEVKTVETTTPERSTIMEPSFVEETVIHEDLQMPNIQTGFNPTLMPGGYASSLTPMVEPSGFLPTSTYLSGIPNVETKTTGQMPEVPAEVVTTIREVYQVVQPGAPHLMSDRGFETEGAEEVTTKVTEERWGHGPIPPDVIHSVETSKNVV